MVNKQKCTNSFQKICDQFEKSEAGRRLTDELADLSSYDEFGDEVLIQFPSL